jgi:hypothetical protein
MTKTHEGWNKIDNCTDNEIQRFRCINYMNTSVCLNCKRFYINTPETKEDLFYQIEEDPF